MSKSLDRLSSLYAKLSVLYGAGDETTLSVERAMRRRATLELSEREQGEVWNLQRRAIAGASGRTESWRGTVGHT
jgi:hypothetical protein